MSSDLRILLFADSHLGFDLPVRTRVGRRRRGHDFFANYRAALKPALEGEIDLVVHAGDVFDRPSVVPTVAFEAYEPLRRVADRGVPVFIVPGNHERSRLPHIRFARHPNVHVFDRPRTFIAHIHGATIALSGFPYERRHIRTRFTELLERTGWRREGAVLRLLCIHHCVEGATVGPGDFTFTTAADVIRVRDVPPDFAAVLSGHIHRHQVLSTDLHGRRVQTPILYPGSVERTSFAELGEPKGFMVVHFAAGEGENDRDMRWEFRRLPSRPMIREELATDNLNGRALESAIRSIISAAPRDGVVSIRVAGALADEHWRALSAARLRAFVPETMNVEISPAGGFARPPRLAPRADGASSSDQLSLYEHLRP